ncbi:MAG TPA: tetratricopeptide repeat protein [Ramlibacter sp.]|nr:tetratricopeptide repeat protein [Ramlibacter sp.]
MTEPTSPLDSDDLRILAEIGFMGAQSGQAPAARALFEALAVLRPLSTLPHIGLAQAAMGANKNQEGVRILREALKKHPGDVELTAFLGLALHASGEAAQARKMMNTVIEKASEADATSVAMARKLLALDSMGTPRPLGQIA